MIECPYCNKKFKSLIRHLPTIHGVFLDDFKKQFPLVPLHEIEPSETSASSVTKQIKESLLTSQGLYRCPDCSREFKSWGGITTHYQEMHHKSLNPATRGKRNDERFKCPECGKYLKDSRGLSVHLAMIHNKKKVPASLTRSEGYKCPMCNGVYQGLSDHVKLAHYMSWEEFVKEYSWTQGTRYISNSYKENLSIQKKSFYKTERGLEYKRIQSERNLGDKNPAKTKEVRAKISKAQAKNFVKGSDDVFTFSYGFHWKEEGKWRHCRSFNEFIILRYFNQLGVKYSYEPFLVEYFDKDGVKKNYIPDVVIGKILYEIKISRKEFLSQEKYEYIKESLKGSEYSLEPLVPSELKDKFGKRFFSPLEQKEMLRKRFYSDDSLFIVYQGVKQGKGGVLKATFQEGYEDFLIENNKRRKNYNESC